MHTPFEKPKLSGIYIHGVCLSSHDEAIYEYREMLNFMELAQLHGITQYLDHLFYKEGCCSVVMKIEPREYDPLSDAVLEIGQLTLGQFIWNGSACGFAMTENEEWARNCSRDELVAQFIDNLRKKAFGGN